MTIIEFFDKNHIDNLASTLLLNPEKVVFIGNNEKQMERSIKNYKAALAPAQTEFKAVGIKNDLDLIFDKLEQELESAGTCYFDLNGGGELFLVAVGMLYQKYGDRVQLHNYNVHLGVLLDRDKDGIPCSSGRAEISIENYVTAYGGRIMKKDAHEQEEWDFNDRALCSDIDFLWDFCFKNTGSWNTLVNYFGNLLGHFSAKDSLTLRCPRTVTEQKLKQKNGTPLQLKKDFLTPLQNAGLLKMCRSDGDDIIITFKDMPTKRFFSKAGAILELKIALTAFRLKNPDGTPLYNDVKTGVYLDWNTVADEKIETYNEIDVIVMDGVEPAFVSCKNGAIPVDELYKLNAVAERFGGKYAKKVLVASGLGNLKSDSGNRAVFIDENIRDRAGEMKIKIIDSNCFKSEARLQKALKNLFLP